MHHRFSILLLAFSLAITAPRSAVAQDRPFFQRLQDATLEVLGISPVMRVEQLHGQREHGEVVVEGGIMEGVAIGRAIIGEAVMGEAIVEAAPPERVKQQRQSTTDRLRARLQAMADWIKHQCPLDADQEAALPQLIEETLQQSQRPKPSNLQQQQVFSSNLQPTSPVLFAGLNGIGFQISREFIELLHKRLLTESQKKTLSTALDERRRRLQATWKEHLIFLLDEELFLTPEQIAAFNKELAATQVQHPLYAFQPQPYFLPYESVQKIVSDKMGASFLDENQQAHLKNLLTADPNQNVITIDASMTSDDMAQGIATRSQRQEQHFLLCTAVRIGWYRNIMQLEPEKIRQLEVAAKGAARDAATEWRDSTNNSVENILQNIEQFAGNVSMGVAEPVLNPDRNQIWAKAIAQILPNATNDPMLASRDANASRIRAEVLLALLDEELWLTSEQRTSLLPLVAATVPRVIPKQYPDYFREITLVAYPLTRMDEAPRNAVLTPQQQVVWGQLAAFFRIRKEFGQGAVEFLMQDMGNWTLMLGE